MAIPERLPAPAEADLVLELRDCSFYYGASRAVANVSLPIYKNRITALIGPSGCGKSTVLRGINLLELTPGARVEGQIIYCGRNLYDGEVDPVELRRRIGMVFQKPNPFPKSIFDNVAYGPRLLGIKKKGTLDEIVERSLRGARGADVGTAERVYDCDRDAQYAASAARLRLHRLLQHPQRERKWP